MSSELLLTYPCHLNRELYRSYMHFHVFRRNHSSLKWIGFCFLIIFFSYCNFRVHSPILGTFFLLLALYLLLSRFLRYRLSVDRICREYTLTEEPKLFYTLTFHEDHFQVENEKESMDYPFSQVHHLYILPDVLYLYMNSQTAFLLPISAENSAEGERLHSILQAALPPDRISVIHH